MSQPARIFAPAWIVAPIAAGRFGFWLAAGSVQRVERIASLRDTETVAGAASPTGYADGLRQLTVPGHENASCKWIVQTPQILARELLPAPLRART